MGPEMRMLEGVSVPEFFVTHIGKVERLPGCIRFYVCVQEGENLLPIYRSIWPQQSLVVKDHLFAMMGELDAVRAH